ncbi:tetratricopeptide repeat protein [Paraburkholderia sp.]|uniref:tetratricopeptide repeat protein n=1 Tax=Paraburkholderia sp. TaxID=1926495 RepID=UPI003D6E1525
MSRPASTSAVPSSAASALTVVSVLMALAGVAVVAALQYAVLAHFARVPDAHIDPLWPVSAAAVVGGAAQAVLFRFALPLRYHEPRGWTLAALWLACTFVPVGAGLVVLASCAWAACWPAKRDDDTLADVPVPEFVTYLVSRVSHGGGARLQARLVNTQVAASDRLSALVAIQSMPTRTTGTLLRDLLADPIEDVRLIAYGTLDRAENEIMQKIFQTSQTLDEAADDAQRHAIHRRLAELYFELVYQNLVQGAVYKHTLEQADRHAQAALATDASDAALWLIRGRLALANSDADAAGQYMDRALALGFPRERLVPWLAEVAFLRGDYPRVGELLASLGNAAALPVLKPVVRYWSS